MTGSDGFSSGELYVVCGLCRVSLMHHPSRGRLTSVVSDWTRVYPGDFAMPEAIALLDDLLQKICYHTHLGMQAGDLACFLENVRDVRDHDTSWSTMDGTTPPQPLLARTHLDRLADKSRESSQHSELDDTTLEAIASSQIASSVPDQSIETDVNQDPSPVQTVTEHSRRSSKQEKRLDSPKESMEEVLISKRESSETEPVKRLRASSEGSRSLAEEFVDGRSFIRALSVFAEETDIAIAVELCKVDWDLVSQVKVSASRRPLHIPDMGLPTARSLPAKRLP